MKKCTKCGLSKALDMFYKHSGQKSGLEPRCKECKTSYLNSRKNEKLAYDKKYRDDNRDRINSRQLDYYRDNKLAHIARNGTRRALLKSQTPEMNKAELVEVEAMYMYNQIMPGDWHVDHIEPLAKGGIHHPSNLQVLTAHDNMSKGARV